MPNNLEFTYYVLHLDCQRIFFVSFKRHIKLSQCIIILHLLHRKTLGLKHCAEIRQYNNV